MAGCRQACYASRMADLPTISLVVPSLNQGRFLEANLLSLFDQAYPKLQLVIMDGGSTDESLDVIERYRDRCHAVTVGPDDGHYNAINRGFAQTGGEVMGWLNSDDLHMPWCLATVGEVFAQFPQIDWLTTGFSLGLNEAGRVIICRGPHAHSSRAFLRGENLTGGHWPARSVIQQESTFWRRSLWERAGSSLNEQYDLAGDFELWTRFAGLTEIHSVQVPLAGFRFHARQKTATQKQRYFEQAKDVLKKHGNLPGQRKGKLAQRMISSRWSMLRSIGTTLVSPVPRHLVIREAHSNQWQMKTVTN